MRATELLKWWYANISKGQTTGFKDLPVEIDLTPEWISDFERITTISLSGKLRYLSMVYHPEKAGPDHYLFPKGCFSEFNRGHFIFKRKNEIFPKLPSDLLYIQRLTGYDEIRLSIPIIWVRTTSVPLAMHYCRQMNYETSPWMQQYEQVFLKRWPTPKSLMGFTRHALRVTMLRYWYAQGKISDEEFYKFKRDNRIYEKNPDGTRVHQYLKDVDYDGD